MTQKTNFTETIHSTSIGKRMLQGAAIALIVISLFLIGTEAEPDWPELWFLRPLLVVPVAGALGGIFYYFMEPLGAMRGWQKVLGILLILLGYVIILWLGIVLGLDGTLWD